MEKKKKILRLILIFTIILIILLLLYSPFLFVNIKLIGDKDITLNYGEKYSEAGYRVNAFNKEIANSREKVQISNDIKEDIGDYKVTYSYKFLFYKIETIRNVHVKDISGPKIELNKGQTYETVINEEFVEPGFSAIDNKDADLTANVTVDGVVDVMTLGDYELTYTVADSAGNKSAEKRKVKVVRKNPSQMSIAEYSLDGWYEETKLKETADQGNEYFNTFTLVGDSNIKNMYLAEVITGIRAWAVPCLHASSMYTEELNLYGYRTKMLLLDAVQKYKPQRLILNFGSFSTKWITEDVFIENANSIIEKIKEISPDTQLVLISIYPITEKGVNINKFDQNVINKINFLILEIANKHNLKFLNVQEALKDETGYGNPIYYRTTDNFHLIAKGQRVVRDYIRTHALEGIE